MCVVPVQISHPDSNKVLDTYAVLENCSQCTFVKEEIIETLGITGAETRVTVKTLNGEISQMTTVFENLKVAGSLGKPKWIKLPRAYTKPKLPVDEHEIATPAKVKRWNYLEGIANEICLNIDISVGLLISANCAEAFSLSNSRWHSANADMIADMKSKITVSHRQFFADVTFSAPSKVQNYQNKNREKSLYPNKYMLTFKEF